MTHAEHSKKAKLATPCTQWDITFGGRCLKCGYDPVQEEAQEKLQEKRS